MSTVNKNILEGTVIGTVLTALSYMVALHFGWADSVNYLEAFAVFTSYLCTYLCVKERRINYPIGAISTAAYCVLFFQQDLVASAVLNAYLTPSLVYGWFRWKADSVTRPVSHVAAKMVPVYLVVTAAAFGIATLLITGFGGKVVLTDSLILVGTILAQFLLDNKKIENWIVWAFVNGFAIYTYATAGLALAAFQYVFFLANTLYGYFEWNKSMKADTPVAIEPAAAATIPLIA
jgi:nicotinamide mononucleotide transporter